jgi:hypothetical protein
MILGLGFGDMGLSVIGVLGSMILGLGFGDMGQVWGF